MLEECLLELQKIHAVALYEKEIAFYEKTLRDMKGCVTLKVLVQNAQKVCINQAERKLERKGCLVMSQAAVKQQSSSNAKSVGKTFAILSTFNETTPTQRTSDIASKLNMNISTVSRHLNTMLDWGYLQRDDTTGFYSLGLEIVALAGTALQNSSIYRFAYPELQRLSYKYGVHSHMSVPRGAEMVHLISICCENTMELLIPMGHCHPMYCSAMGRAVMSYQSSGEIQRVLRYSELKKFTPETKVDVQEIQQELVRTRQKGYCIIFDELSENVGSLAVPIFDRNRNPVAAISVSASAHSLSQPQRERELAKAVTTAAGKISGKLGYYPK